MPSSLVFCSMKLFVALCSVRGPGGRPNLGLFVFCSSVRAVEYYDSFLGSLGELRIM
jgi:hypothetical protein